MSNQEKAAQGSAATAKAKVAEAKVEFSAMDKSQKLSYIGKVCLFLLTFGFAFPGILSD
jgi:hypothetical protein